jgi:hypothetical protein
VRIGLTREQVRGIRNPRLRCGIEVKLGDTRSERYIEQYGARCWETDILPAATIRFALEYYIEQWLDRELWERRQREIERARTLL